MEFLLVAYTGIVFAVVRIICFKKQYSSKKSFFVGFLSVFLAFVVGLTIGTIYKISSDVPIPEYRIYLWFLGAFVLSIGAGIKCAMGEE